MTKPTRKPNLPLFSSRAAKRIQALCIFATIALFTFPASAQVALPTPHRAVAPTPTPEPISPMQPAVVHHPLGPVTVSAREGKQHLLTKANPVYPAIARIAHLQGEVVLRVLVSEDGSVKDIRAISGPPMLIPASIDAAKTWRYERFMEEGQPVEANVEIKIAFTLSR